MKILMCVAILCALTSAGCAAMLGYTIRLNQTAKPIEPMCPVIELQASFDGFSVYKVKTCEGATMWLQTPDLLSQGIE